MSVLRRFRRNASKLLAAKLKLPYGFPRARGHRGRAQQFMRPPGCGYVSYDTRSKAKARRLAEQARIADVAAAAKAALA